MISLTKVFPIMSVLLGCIVNAKIANPCGLTFSDTPVLKCENGANCASTLWYPRKAFCAKLPLNPACICRTVEKPVCCQVILGSKSSITMTQGNSCLCNCRGGKVLFENKCSRPPSMPKLCPLDTDGFFPTCCYIRKFDLTVLASNSCICERNYGGITTKLSFCGIEVHLKSN